MTVSTFRFEIKFENSNFNSFFLFLVYYFGGQSAHNVQAVLPHKPDPSHHDQIQMKSGDLIGIAGNHWNGYSKGKNLRTNVS